jgi:hypothetical protein
VSVTSTKLKERTTNAFVDAELHDSLSPDDMIDSEGLWRAERLVIAQALDVAGGAREDWPQHLHWDWAAKLRVGSGLDVGGPLSPYRLMGIRVRGEEHWQGLVLTTSIGHREKIGGRGRDILYIKYLETAPWNLVVETLGRTGRYGGVGPQLLRASIALSRALGLRGRVGLHALPQAERFYRDDCGMTDLDIDTACERLRYFELTEEQAATFLRKGRGDRR